MIRYHSCYPWHTGGCYKEFMTENDDKLLTWVKEFNKYDLYTKDQDGFTQSIDELWPYYESLIKKYFPTENLMW